MERNETICKASSSSSDQQSGLGLCQSEFLAAEEPDSSSSEKGPPGLEYRKGHGQPSQSAHKEKRKVNF
jgi:hypothetical protein